LLLQILSVDQSGVMLHLLVQLIPITSIEKTIPRSSSARAERRGKRRRGIALKNDGFLLAARRIPRPGNRDTSPNSVLIDFPKNNAPYFAPPSPARFIIDAMHVKH
jgi:hypothetical protein